MNNVPGLRFTAGFFLVTIGGFSAVASDPIELPVQYDQDRFFVIPVIAEGDAMRLLTDTGGGVLFFDDAALRLKLSVSGVSLTEYKGMAAKFPNLASDKQIPPPKTEGDVIPIAPGPVRSRLSWLTKDIDGIIGQGWFADRVWTLDYPAKKLLYYPDQKARVSDKAKRVELGFRQDDRGRRMTNYPRFQMTVSGQTFDVLLATGSSVAITADALKVIEEGGAAIRSTSLISTEIFENWKKEHADWRVVSNAEEGSGEPMIEVPKISIAGFEEGPVWFTRRPDNNFSDHFSNWTDKPVVGAIGGNALKHFRLTLDYPNAVAWFERP